MKQKKAAPPSSLDLPASQIQFCHLARAAAVARERSVVLQAAAAARGPVGAPWHPGCGPGCDNLITVGLRNGTAATQGSIKYLTSYALISLFFVWSTNFFVCFFLE